MDDQERRQRNTEAKRRWRDANRERVKEYERNRERPPGYNSEAAKRWNAAHPEQRKASARSSYVKNKERSYARRDARRDWEGSFPHISMATRRVVREFYDGGCAYCGTPCRGWDHVLPRSKGGTHTIDNMVPCCPPCNKRKHVSTPAEAGLSFRPHPLM